MGRRVALDPGSSDPTLARAAVVAALEADATLEVVLAGPYDRAHVDDLERCRLLPAAGPLEPGRDPAVAVRGRADLPIRVVLDLLSAGEADAAVSAAPTEAVLTAVRFALPRRIGVRHPLLGVPVRTPDGRTRWLCDVSGRSGTTAAALAEAAAQLGDEVGILTTTSHPRTAERACLELMEGRGLDCTPVPVEAWATSAPPVLLADGAVGGALLAGARGVAPDAVGPARVLGVDGAVWLPTAGDADALATTVATAAQAAAAEVYP